MYVKLQLNGQYRNQASGGSCRALTSIVSLATAHEDPLVHLPTQKVANHIGMANNDFKLVFFALLVLIFGRKVSPIEILAKGLFNPRMILISRFNDFGIRSRTRNVMAWSIENKFMSVDH